MPVDPLQLPYRRGVGLCLFNTSGLVLLAERRDCADAWQFPQGGINRDEAPHLTALRELKEEVGTDNAEIIAQLPARTFYEFPDWLQYRGGVFRGKYRGQEQDWFALRFLGSDKEINLSGEHEPEAPEFIAWKWVRLTDSIPLIVPFKRKVYEQVIEGFMPLAKSLAAGEAPPPWKPTA